MSIDSFLLAFVVVVLIVSPAANHGVTGNSFMTYAAIAQSAPRSVLEPLRTSQPQYPTDPVNITRNYPSPPAPTGIADYGVENAGGKAVAYKLEMSSVTGTVMLNSINSSSGESLQLNVVMRVNTTSASYVYWLQNVFWPSQKTIAMHSDLVSSIWNWTIPYGTLNPARISGTHGGVVFDCSGGCGTNPNYYYGSERFSNYSLPLGLRLRINVSYTGSSVNIYFSSASAMGTVPFSTHTSTYDTVMISEPNTVTAVAILVDGNEMAPGIQLGRVTYYEAEFVFAGIANLETTTFTSMNSTISMSYTLENGSVVAPFSVYEFGETGEKAANLAVTPIDQLHGFQFHVGIGTANSSADYVRKPQVLNPLTARYSFPGEPPSGMTAVLDYVNNGTETFATLGTNPMTFRADAGTVWQIITIDLPSNSTVRWSPSPAGGIVSGAQTINVVYYRQFLVRLGFAVTGGGTGYSNPEVTFDQFGSTISAQAGSSVWMDAGTSYSYSDQLPGSTSSERWISNSTSGGILGPGEIQVNYEHQYQVTIATTGGGSLLYGLGSSTGTVSPGTAQAFYVQPGTEISLSAVPTSFWYEFGGWNGAGGDKGSQIKETIASPTILKGEFSIDFVKITEIAAIVGVFLVVGIFLLRRRFRSRTSSMALHTVDTASLRNI